MQKVGRVSSLLMLFSISLVVSAGAEAAAPDPAVAKKIQELSRKIVAEQRKVQQSTSKEAYLLEVMPQRLPNLLLRIETMENSLQYYSRMKRKLTMDVMDKLTPDVARACCPLNPNALQGHRWYFKNKGNKLKGKGLSGLREGKGKGKGNGKGRGRKRGRGGGGGGNSEAAPEDMDL